MTITARIWLRMYNLSLSALTVLIFCPMSHSLYILILLVIFTSTFLLSFTIIISQAQSTLSSSRALYWVDVSIEIGILAIFNNTVVVIVSVLAKVTECHYFLSVLKLDESAIDRCKIVTRLITSPAHKWILFQQLITVIGIDQTILEKYIFTRKMLQISNYHRLLSQGMANVSF